MPRKTLRLSLSALLVTLLFGCATAPKLGVIPPRETADDCLVLLPLKFENKTGASSVRKYAYEFSGEYDSITLPNASGYLAMIIHEPGVVLTKLKTFVPEGQGFVGPKGEYDVNITLPYEAGKMAVFPRMFVLQYRSDGAGGYISYTDMVKTDETTLKETMEHAAAQANAISWQ